MFSIFLATPLPTPRYHFHLYQIFTPQSQCLTTKVLHGFQPAQPEQRLTNSKGALGGLTDTVGKTGKGLTDTVSNTVSGAGKGASDTVGSATKGASDTAKGMFFFPIQV